MELSADILRGGERAIAALPNEILDQIFSQIDGPPPSDATIYNEPSFELTSSPFTDLKARSLVCQRWRRLIMPRLFKHMRLIILNPQLPPPSSYDEDLPMLEFVQKNYLSSCVMTFTLCIEH